MRRTRRPRPQTDSSYRLVLPADTMAAAKAIAQVRGETLAQWLRRAVRTQIYIDAVGPDGDTVIRLIRQGAEPAVEAATRAADAAQAAALLSRAVLARTLEAQGLPLDQATAQAAAAWDEAWAGVTPADPAVPDWLTGPEDPPEEV